MVVETPSLSSTLDVNGDFTAPAVPIAEPDYRFTLANERTFLAWQRTALGLLAAAVGVVQFLPELGIPGLRHILGGAIGVIAMLTSAAGLHRWAQVDHAIRRDQPLPRPSTPIYLTVALMAVGLVTVALALAATAATR
jgi:putative membrane protein